MKRGYRIGIYESWWHLIVTFLVIIAPFLFLLFFSKVESFHTAKLLSDVWDSFLRLFIAYIIAVIIAWVCAIAFFRGKRAKVALPIFDVLQSFPTFAALPLAVYLWGASSLTVIIFLVITVIWPILFSIVSSLKLLRNDWEEAVEISDLHGWNYLKNFILPLSIPGLITGSVIGLGEGWEALVATEIIIDIQSGLGPFFKLFSNDPTITAWGIFGFLILIFSINKIVWIPLLEWSHRKMEE